MSARWWRHARDAAILYVVDATEQKALEEKYAQSQKMEAVGKLAGGIAHDFNNVLTAILGFSDLLLQTHRPGDPAYRDIINIKNSATRAAGLVGQLLGFSRRQTQQNEPGPRRDDLCWIADAPDLGRRDVKMVFEPPRDLWSGPTAARSRTSSSTWQSTPAMPCRRAARSPSTRSQRQRRESQRLARRACRSANTW